MSIYSFRFIVSFALMLILLAVLQLLRRKTPHISRIQLLLLLMYSYVYIVAYNWMFFVCIIIVTIITYTCGIGIFHSRDVDFCVDSKLNKSALCLGGGVIAQIGMLGYFKYSEFFVNSVRTIIGKDSIVLDIILPIGISFYIFSSISYLIDVYRGEYSAQKNIINIALYISFFPKLVAGPIVRGGDFFPQVSKYQGIMWSNCKEGIQIFVFGLFKKIVLADHLGVFVDDIFYAPIAYDTGTLILGAISYSLQIYFDFSGYSDMAIGISKIIGFDFKSNFNLPYIARNVSEFWQRWHISLSSWFKDYMYIPLGGNRKGTVRTCINLMIVMTVSGLWHGAAWTYVAWGVVYGVLCVINKLAGKWFIRMGSIVNGIITFLIVTLLWVVFRADSFTDALDVYKGIFTIHDGISQPYTWSFFAIVCFVIAIVIAWHHSKKMGEVDKKGNFVINGFYPLLDLSRFWHLVIFLTFCGITVMMGYFGDTAFIYGSF